MPGWTTGPAYGFGVAKADRPQNRYELLTCAWKGHALVGADVGHRHPRGRPAGAGDRRAPLAPLPAVRRLDTRAPSGEPSREAMPPRDEITVPDHGPVLRDRYVLRLIAIDRAIHVIVLSGLAVALFTFASHHSTLQNDYNQIMNDLSGGDPGATSVRGFLGHLRNAFHYSPRHLIELGLLLTAYAALEASEMVGLWYAKRWAEYLTFIATVLLVPFELYELSNGVSVFKVLTLVINLAIVVYLLLAKRLFGLHGGHKVVVAERQRLGGWGAIERATPGATVPA